ncbi:hypothetical protein FJD29_16120 [Escherichia coli]|nr:hypothetical protein [Escherichia coli]HBY4493703.1 hypothetical protein [Klebsiella pneumoniae]
MEMTIISSVLWMVFCIMRRTVRKIGAMIGITQSDWWFGMFSDRSERTIRVEFPQSDLLFGATI